MAHKKKETEEVISSEEFNSRMEHDEEFRKEMRRRQAAALAKLSSKEHNVIARRKRGVKYAETEVSDDFVFHGGGLSQSFIQRAKLSTLRKAVKNKKMSPSRYRMEVARRRKKDYFDSLPELEYSSSSC